MNDDRQDPPPTLSMSAEKPPTARFSLERLSSAFARLMGTPTAGRSAAAKPQVAVDGDQGIDDDDALPVTPRMIVEGMLFVGGADGRALASRELASQVRDLTVAEVDAIVVELNERYRDDDAAYEIVGDGDGYRLQLRRELGRMRERIKGRVRAAKLSPAAIEVLSVVAYRQGITGEELNRARGSQSHALLAQLVRRQLVRVERSEQLPRAPQYYTTERFNQLFGVKSPADLPRREDLDDS
ncbi:MAG TPA: SMC-Scp complex subunit ScpB [Lacipirellula sp.]